MVLRCLACGVENPATNSYCGQCGANLHRSATETPEPDVREPGAETEDEARAKEEAERKRRTEVARWMEIELESRGIYMPWNIKDPAKEPAHDAADGRTSLEAASEPRATQPPDGPNAPDDGERVEAQSTVRTSTPLAPGHNDDAVAQQNVREREEESHPWRNIALAILVTTVILGSAEWRPIRDYAVAYLQSSQQAKQREEQAATPPAMAADNVSPAPAKEPPVAAARPEGRIGPDLTSAHSENVPAPGAAEMYQAAHAADSRLRAAWLWKAVRAGNPQAPVELAKMYEDGDGVVRSCDEAQILLNAAAAKGNAQAKLDLQRLQLRGGCSEP